MANFSDLLKKWFYTKNSSAASSDARVPLLDASGNPKGSDTMANLASVLGEQYTQFVQNDDLNTFKSFGWYCTTSTAISLSLQNKPSGVTNGNFSLYVFKQGGFVIQYFYTEERTWVRTFYNSWHTWEELAYDVPTFYKDYNTPASLASALGVKPNRIENVDINNLLTTAVYWFDGSSAQTVIHYPFGWGLLNVYADDSGDLAVYQIADDMRGSRKSRNYNMEKAGWTEWVNL